MRSTLPRLLNSMLPQRQVRSPVQTHTFCYPDRCSSSCMTEVIMRECAEKRGGSRHRKQPRAPSPSPRAPGGRASARSPQPLDLRPPCAPVAGFRRLKQNWRSLRGGQLQPIHSIHPCLPGCQLFKLRVLLSGAVSH